MNTETNQEDPPYEYFSEICEKIGTDWRRLSWKLDPSIDIDAIAEDYHRAIDRARAVLNRWNQAHSSNATFDILVEALDSIQRKDIADKIRTIRQTNTNNRPASSGSSQLSRHHLLRNVPETPSAYYIERQSYIQKIIDYLKRIDSNELGGHILIHGMAGSGKTVIASQSVRLAIYNYGLFRSGGVYWIKIGNIREDEFVTKLRSLYIQITKNIQNICQLPDKVDEMVACLQAYLEGDKNMKKTLFIFDDVASKHHFDKLKFAKNTISTSRFNHFRNKPTNSQHYIQLSELLSEGEAMQILAKYYSEEKLSQHRQLVLQAINKCAGLPLAISLIGGLNCKTSNDWENAVNTIERRDMIDTQREYNFNLYAAFDLSINHLDHKERVLFQLLSVFKRVQIPKTSIMALWNEDKHYAELCLKNLNARSLLKFDESRCYLVLHDLIIDYLQQLPCEHQSPSDHWKWMHQTLVNGYLKECEREGRDWSSFPNDYYYYQYLIYHVIQAENDIALESIMTDFNWMSAKIEAHNGLYDLRLDLINCIQYLQKIGKDWQKFNELLHLFNQYESFLDGSTGDLVQFLLMFGKKNHWITEKAIHFAANNTKNRKSYYWMINVYPDIQNAENAWIASKKIGAMYNDRSIRCCISSLGNLLIIGTNNNGRNDCQIVGKNYETSQVLFKLTPLKQDVYALRISIDGTIIAYRYECEIWRIDGSQIQSVNNPFFFEAGVHQCEFIQNGRMILFWRNQDHQFDKKREIISYKLQIWDIEEHQYKQIYTVPARIIWSNNQVKLSNNVGQGHILDHVVHIGQRDATIAMAYGKILGVIATEPNSQTTFDIVQNFGNFFVPIYQSPFNIDAIKISNDGQLIAILSHYEITVIKTINGLANKCLKIDSPIGLKKLSFIPKTPRLLVYEYENSQSVYEYNLSEWQSGWNDILLRRQESIGYEDYENIIDTSCTFIDDIPVVAQLITCGAEGNCEIKIFQGYRSEQKFSIKLDEKYQQCFLYDDFPSAILVGVCKCPENDDLPDQSLLRWHITIAELTNFQCTTTGTREKRISEFHIPDQVKEFRVISSRYRKADSNIILIVNIMTINHGERALIIMVDSNTLARINCFDYNTEIHEQIRIIYFDDYNLITRQWVEDCCKCSIKWYKIGTDRIKLKQQLTYQFGSGLALKIDVITKNIGKLKMKVSIFNLDQEIFKRIWGPNDTEIFKAIIPQDRNEYFLITKEDHFSVLDPYQDVLVKGFKKNKLELSTYTQVLNIENLWSQKFYFTFDRVVRKMYIYQATTLKLLHILSFPYFTAWSMKWNSQQSSFILTNAKNQYSILCRVPESEAFFRQ
ncbi:Apoptotic protease-activating factor 1 [Trichoplax sp. H2]|nr:Apoptotic protease-activating factor 1 [Trichoplax sp. H2]|eukprot:RDD46820.1 Apoptotic protease-activating factor 1 [Trichoplax sp. H2]